MQGIARWRSSRHRHEARLRLLVHVFLPTGETLPRLEAAMDTVSVDWPVAAAQSVHPRAFHLKSAAVSFRIGDLAVVDDVRASSTVVRCTITPECLASEAKSSTFKPTLAAFV